MKITRGENSISWQDENCGGSVGITSILYAEPDDDRRKAHSEWVEHCARRVVADPHTVPEAIAWMNARWDAEPLPFDHWRVRHTYGSLVEQFCGDRLTHLPGDFSMDMSDEAFIHWHRETEARRLLQYSGVGCDVIGRKIAMYMGLTQEDIDNRTNRFLAYIMDGADTFPSFEAFMEIRKTGRANGADN